MEKLALGLMSGTSADGCSVALASFSKNSCRVLAYRTYAYPSSLFKRILRGANLSAPEISGLNFEMGAHHAKAVLQFLKSEKVSAAKISVIGSHGQTLYHGPEDRVPNTLQVGEPAVIAERTGITVVSDFRPRDIAAGGQGAPLIPHFDQYFFGSGQIRAMQNIGGISNVCVVGKTIARPIAFDNGPGNCLMDWAVRAATDGRKTFDVNGEQARRGRIDHDSVRKMAAHPYFSRRPPKSTGRELFDETFLPANLRRRVKRGTRDALATLNYFTAWTIAESYRRFLPKLGALSEVVVSGGGALNKTLMDHLARLLDPIPVRTIERYGLPVQAKEPAAFAFFALRAMEGKINHLPETTGAHRACILGNITPGRSFKGIK